MSNKIDPQEEYLQNLPQEELRKTYHAFRKLKENIVLSNDEWKIADETQKKVADEIKTRKKNKNWNYKI